MARNTHQPPEKTIETILAEENARVLAQKTPVQTFKFIPDMDDAELRQLAREKLSEALQAINPVQQPELTRKLCAEVKDRLDGKPGQAVTIDQRLQVVTVNANIEFIQPNRDKVISGQPDNKITVIDQ